VDGALADEVLGFWVGRGALDPEQAKVRLPEVVCLLRLDGELHGVSSAYEADVPLIGGRRFWIYRNLLDDAVAAHGPELIRATFAALEAEFDRSPAAPVGLCVLVADDPVERRRRPEVEWSDPRMIYAGYLSDRRQVRIAYFDGADITRRS
jgi:hypothetical protein